MSYDSGDTFVSADWCLVYIQGGVAEPADRTREVNERLLMEVRRRLQEAKSQLHTGADGAPSEVDAGTPVDSPLGGRPKVLQGQGSSGTTLTSALWHCHCVVNVSRAHLAHILPNLT